MILEKNFKDKVKIRIDTPQKNFEKFSEVLLYVFKKLESKQLSKTAIYSMLYFIDFDYYEKYEEQLIGLTYIKDTHGPTPLEFNEVIGKMLQNSDTPLREPDLSKLKPDELETVDKVIKKLGDMSDAEISEYSKGDIPWIGTGLGKLIKYEAVFYRTPEYSVRKTEFDKNDEIDIFVDDTYD
jgi:hypothetical protein